MNKIYIGIDPGVTGAIAILHDDDSGFLEKLPTRRVPNKSRREKRIDGREFYKLIPKIRSTVVLEKTQPMRDSAMTAFSMGQSRGILYGILDACMMPVFDVTPQQWKKHFGLIGKGKDASIAKAVELYPRWKERIGRNHNLAEALLLARYGKDLGL